MNFTVLSYNILDFNLSSNTVPRTMDVKSFEKINKLDSLPIPEGKTQFSFRNDDKGRPITGVKNILNNEYGTYYHNYTKGLGFMDHNFKRKLWGQNIKSQDEYDKFVSNYGNVDEYKHLTFVDVNTFKFKDTIVKNLKGILDMFYENMELPNDSSIYDEIIDYDNNISAWSVRGHRVGKKIMEMNADVLLLQEYGPCHDIPFETGQTLYKFLAPVYDCIFFVNPISSKIENGGVAIYFKRDKFRVSTSDSFKHELKNDPSLSEYRKLDLKKKNAVQILVDSDTSDFKCLHTFDLDKNTKLDKPENLADRRSLGFAKLQLLDSKREVLFITAHLMTDSKDKDGLVKAQELLNVSNYLCDEISKGNISKENDGIVFGGDFNIIFNSEGKPYGDRGIFGKDFTGEMHLPCGINLTDTLIDKIDNLSRISSVNNTRKDWIDYIFYANLIHNTTQFDDITDIYIPNIDHPSDHIPLLSSFGLKPIEGGYYKKYLKYKQKYINLKKTINY